MRNLSSTDARSGVAKETTYGCHLVHAGYAYKLGYEVDEEGGVRSVVEVGGKGNTEDVLHQ